VNGSVGQRRGGTGGGKSSGGDATEGEARKKVGRGRSRSNKEQFVEGEKKGTSRKPPFKKMGSNIKGGGDLSLEITGGLGKTTISTRQEHLSFGSKNYSGEALGAASREKEAGTGPDLKGRGASIWQLFCSNWTITRQGVGKSSEKREDAEGLGEKDSGSGRGASGAEKPGHANGKQVR